MDGDKSVRLVARRHRGGQQVHAHPRNRKVMRHAPGDAKIDVHLLEAAECGAGIRPQPCELFGKLVNMPVACLDPHAPGAAQPAVSPTGRRRQVCGGSGRDARGRPRKEHRAQQDMGERGGPVRCAGESPHGKDARDDECRRAEGKRPHLKSGIQCSRAGLPRQVTG